MPQRCFLQRASISIKYSVSLRGQGFALGSVLQGIAVDETGHFIGAIWDWLSGQSVCSRFDANPGLSPLIWTILIFLLSFIGLGLIVFPYIIPVQITIYKSAAAPVRWYLCWFLLVFDPNYVGLQHLSTHGFSGQDYQQSIWGVTILADECDRSLKIQTTH